VAVSGAVDQFGDILGAASFRFPAARAESASGRGVLRVGNVSFEDDTAARVAFGGVGCGDCREQRLGVGVEGLS
jgi:hypothetical protein